MSDLIRREEAIHAVNKAFDRETLLNTFVRSIAINALNTMPSAEPEQKLDEWCTDCKEYDQEKHCCHRWNRVIRTTVEEMKQQKHGKWDIEISADGYQATYRCSECGHQFKWIYDPHFPPVFNYCQKCGADMREKS